MQSTDRSLAEIGLIRRIEASPRCIRLDQTIYKLDQIRSN